MWTDNEDAKFISVAALQPGAPSTNLRRHPMSAGLANHGSKSAADHRFRQPETIERQFCHSYRGFQILDCYP